MTPIRSEAIRNPVRGEDGLSYIALPYLVLMKMASGRMQDMADISRMLGGANGKRIEETRQLINRVRGRDIEDLESLIALGKLEHES